MTRRGRALEAIRIATFASVMGGLISGFALLLLARPLAGVALWFGPAEMFLIALLGLISIAAVSAGFLLRGLIAGCFGLWLSTFGVDNYSGFPRYTFGYEGFLSGIGILPAIVGLFAFAQGLELCRADARGTVSGVTKLSWKILPRWSEIWYARWALVRGWTVGLVMGLIPAAGASVAQWVAYAWEVRQRKPGDKFGEGEPKGLASTEASNNGVTGTSLIPLFVLGIPGGISAAVILGALSLHGLQPGMRLFRTSPDIVYTIMWGFILANIVMGVVAAIMARILAYLTLFPRGILGPLILVFSVIGTYAGTRNFHDVYIMIAFGFIGYYAQLWRFSPAAILLGLILGPIAENGLRDLLVVSRDTPIMYILGRPQSLVILGLIALVIWFSRAPKKWAGRGKQVAEEIFDKSHPEPPDRGPAPAARAPSRE